MAGALLRYRIMAYIVGVGLFTLTFVGVPLQYGFGHPGVDKYVGAIHGIFYIVYLVAALDLARRARFSIPDMAMMVGAGLLPILAFVVERRITAAVRAGVRPWRTRRSGGALGAAQLRPAAADGGAAEAKAKAQPR